MQCNDIVHSDIRPRNILVSLGTGDDGTEEAEFHLIDFGIARQIHVIVDDGYRDACLVAEVLSCMMLGEPNTTGYKACPVLYGEVQVVSRRPGWPYSNVLVKTIWDLFNFEILESSQYRIAIPNGRMRRLQQHFGDELAACKAIATQAGIDDSLELYWPLQNLRPLLVKNFMPLTKSGKPACCPFRRAQIDPKTFEVLSVGEVDIWVEHFADVCWKSDPKGEERQKASDATTKPDSGVSGLKMTTD